MNFRHLHKLSVFYNLKSFQQQLQKFVSATRNFHASFTEASHSSFPPCAPNCFRRKTQSSAPSFSTGKAYFSSYTRRLRLPETKVQSSAIKNASKATKSFKENTKSARASKIKSEKLFAKEAQKCDSAKEGKRATPVTNKRVKLAKHEDELKLKAAISSFIQSTRRKYNSTNLSFSGSGSFQIAYRTPVLLKPKRSVKEIKDPMNQQKRLYSKQSKSSSSSKNPKKPKTNENCPEPPCADDAPGLPYFYRRVEVEGEDGQSSKYEMQRIYFKYPNKIIDPNSPKVQQQSNNENSTDVQVEYLKEIVTKTVEKISEDEYTNALSKTPQNQLKEDHYSKLQEKELILPKDFIRRSSSKERDVTIQYRRRISTKSGRDLPKEKEFREETSQKQNPLDKSESKGDGILKKNDDKKMEARIKRPKLNEVDPMQIHPPNRNAKIKPEGHKITRYPWEETYEDFNRKIASKNDPPSKVAEYKTYCIINNKIKGFKHIDKSSKRIELNKKLKIDKNTEPSNEEIKKQNADYKKRLKLFEGSASQKQFEDALTKTISAPISANFASKNIKKELPENVLHRVDSKIKDILNIPVAFRKNGTYETKNLVSEKLPNKPEKKMVPLATSHEKLSFSNVQSYKLPFTLFKTSNNTSKVPNVKYLKKSSEILEKKEDLPQAKTPQNQTKDGLIGRVNIKLKVPDNQEVEPLIFEDKYRFNELSELEKECEKELSSLQAIKSRGNLKITLSPLKELREKVNFSKYVEKSQDTQNLNKLLMKQKTDDNFTMLKSAKKMGDTQNAQKELSEPKRVLNVLDKIWSKVELEARKKIQEIEDSKPLNHPNYKLKKVRTQHANAMQEDKLNSIKDLKIKAEKQLEINSKASSVPNMKLTSLLKPKIKDLDEEDKLEAKILNTLVSQPPNIRKMSMPTLSASIRPSNELISNTRQVRSVPKLKVLEITKVQKSASYSSSADNKSKGGSKCDDSQKKEKKEKKDPFGRCKPDPYKHKQKKLCRKSLDKIDLRCEMKASDCSKSKKQSKTTKGTASSPNDICDLINSEAPQKPVREMKCSDMKKKDKLDDICGKKKKTDPCKKKKKKSLCKKNTCKKPKKSCKKPKVSCCKKPKKKKSSGDSCAQSRDEFDSICKKKAKKSSCKKKADPCEKSEEKEKKFNPCKKSKPKCTAVKKGVKHCGKNRLGKKKKESSCKKKDPCKKSKKASPCKKPKKSDPCKKSKKSSPCKTSKKKDLCKKPKASPCQTSKKKADPCKKSRAASPCGKPKKSDPCMKQEKKIKTIKDRIKDFCKSPTSKNKIEKQEDPCKIPPNKMKNKKKSSTCNQSDSKPKNPCKTSSQTKATSPCKKTETKAKSSSSSCCKSPKSESTTKVSCSSKQTTSTKSKDKIKSSSIKGPQCSGSQASVKKESTSSPCKTSASSKPKEKPKRTPCAAEYRKKGAKVEEKAKGKDLSARRWQTMTKPCKEVAGPKESKSKIPTPICARTKPGVERKPKDKSTQKPGGCSEIVIKRAVDLLDDSKPKKQEKKPEKKVEAKKDPPKDKKLAPPTDKKIKKNSIPPPKCSEGSSKSKSSSKPEKKASSCRSTQPLNLSGRASQPAVKDARHCKSDSNLYSREDVCRYPRFKSPKVHKVSSFKFTILGPRTDKDNFSRICRKKVARNVDKSPPVKKQDVCHDLSACTNAKKDQIDKDYHVNLMEMIEEKKCIAASAMKDIPTIPQRLEDKMPRYLQILRQLQDQAQATYDSSKKKRLRKQTSRCCSKPKKSLCDNDY